MSESKPRPFTDKLLFFGGLWLAIATALLCAIVPSGLPGSESRGSAFNPSNSVVALRAKSTKAVPVIERIADKDSIKPSTPDGWRTAHHLVIPSLPAIQAIAILLPLAQMDVPRGPVSATGLLQAILPRGPPITG